MMRSVSVRELESWIDSGKVLEKDMRGPKVIALANGQYLKIYHTRRHPLLACLFPLARRFAGNAKELAARGISTPQIQELIWLDRPAGLSASLYKPLAGVSLETLFLDNPAGFNQFLPELAAFIHQLHRKGIYFRSLHLGNILRTPAGNYGLIDFLDLKFFARPLGSRLVARNFKHLKSYLIRRKLYGFPLETLMRIYSQLN